MRRVKVIVNPTAGRGYGGQVAPRIERCLSDLGVEYQLQHTQCQGDAIQLAQQARADGFDVVASVGGDGTTNEVVNGLMAHSGGEHAGTLACIPVGSGNDFATMNGVPTDIEGACALIANAVERSVDVGWLAIDGQPGFYFNNTIGIGFDGLVARETRRYKHVRGMAMYVPAVLRTIFVTMKPMRCQIIIDGEELFENTMMMIAANGPREGRTFLVAPNAKCNDGLLDIILVSEMPKLSMLALVPRFMSGTHLSDPRISERKARTVTIRSEDPLSIHVDGELPCEVAHQIEIRLLPGHLSILGGPAPV